MIGRACRDTDGDRHARTCRTLMRERDIVRQAFGEALCANAHWDMLLALYLSERENRKIMLTALCAASFVPEATAYRRIDELEHRGLVLRTNDPRDRRRIYVRLSVDGIMLIDGVLTRINQLIEPSDRRLIEPRG